MTGVLCLSLPENDVSGISIAFTDRFGSVSERFACL